MAPHQVIEDSDEDVGDIASPELLSPSAGSNEIVVNSMMQSSSTDPMLFRAVYEEHLGQLPVNDPIPSDVRSPPLEDPIFNQRMSSSLSIPSARKLKRSKTTNISSLSSITEPSLSSRKAIRPESTKADDDLTQITTPRRSKEATWNDVWEVPSSNASEKAMCGSVMLKSKSSEKNANRKTYGRQIRRSQTATHSTRSASYDLRMSSPMEDDSPQARTQKMPLQDQEGDDSVSSKSTRRKRARLDSSEKQLILAEELSNESRIAIYVTPGNHTGIRVPSENLQVSENRSENIEIGMRSSGAEFFQVPSSPSATNQTVQDAPEGFQPATKSSTIQAWPMASRSIVVVPDVLSEEQKLQYEIVSVASTTQSSLSSQSELTSKISSDEGCAEASDVEGNFTPSLAPSLEMIEEQSRAIFPSSRLPISAANRKMKRANSEMALKNATANSNGKILKRRVRSKTTGPTDKLPCRKASVDELCVISLEFVQKIASKGLARNRGKKAQCENEEERMRNDELHNCGETGLGNEKYESQHKLHQPRSILTPIITDGPTELTNDTIESPNIAGKHACAPALESAVSGFIQPKRRIRKKTSEIIVAKAVSVVDTKNLDSVHILSKDYEVKRIVLNETDYNKQPLQETAITPPAKSSIADVNSDIPVPAQTPTRDSKRGTDQHSPLQSGKMPYRVGLSKKTRIAPLLRMIRK